MADHEKVTKADVDAIIAAKLKAGSVTDTTGADGKIAVTFAEAFASTPVVKVQLEGDVDYYPVITAKSTTGFTVKILKTAHAHSQGNTGAEAAHTHGVSFTSGAGSSHNHNFSGNTLPTHTHSVGYSGYESSHTHSQGSTGGPSATISCVPWGHATESYVAATSGGPTTKDVWIHDTILANYPGSQTHTHTNPTTGAGSSHRHSNPTTGSKSAGTPSGTIGSESTHTHSVSGTSGAGSSHSHTNPDTAQVNAGNLLASTEVTFSYIAMVP